MLRRLCCCWDTRPRPKQSKYFRRDKNIFPGSGAWDRVPEVPQVPGDGGQAARVQGVRPGLQRGVWHAVRAALQGQESFYERASFKFKCHLNNDRVQVNKKCVHIYQTQCYTSSSYTQTCQQVSDGLNTGHLKSSLISHQSLPCPFHGICLWRFIYLYNMWSSNDPEYRKNPKYVNRHDDCVNCMPLSQLKGRTIKSNWCCVRQQTKKNFLIFPHFPKEGIAHLMFREILHWKDDWTIIFLLNSTHHLLTVNLILIWIYIL